MINETTRGTVIKGLPAAGQKKAYELKKSPPGTVARLTAMWEAQEEENKKAKKDSIITEDPPQLKNSPELGMLLPVEPG